GVERERAVGIEVVARSVGRIVFRRRVAGAPIGRVGAGIVGAGDVEGAAAGLPGIVLVLPGLAAGLVGRRNGEGLPEHIAGPGVERDQPVTHARVAARGADDDLVGKRKGSRVERQVGLIAQVPVPDDLAGLLVGRDDAAVMAGDGDDEIAPQRDAAIAVDLLLARI